MAIKSLDAYKLGVIIDPWESAKGIAAIKDTDTYATKAGAALDKLGKSATRSFSDMQRAASEKRKKRQQDLAAALVSGQKNVSGLIADAKKAQTEYQQLEKVQAKAAKLAGSGAASGFTAGFTSTLSSLLGTISLPGLGTAAGAII